MVQLVDLGLFVGDSACSSWALACPAVCQVGEGGRATTNRIGTERFDLKHTTIGIDHSRDMGIGVRIHTTNNIPYQ